jgi:aminoglycoside phosphotransferase (APT) family kinase protein
MFDASVMPERLASFLTRHDGAREATVVAYERMVGGYSRLMAWAEVHWSDGTHERVVLRGDPPPGQSMMETDRDLEWALLTALAAIDGLAMPTARCYDATGEHLGTKCIVLDHVEGDSLQAVLNRIDPEHGYGDHGTELVDTLARVHSVDLEPLRGVIDVPTDWDAYLGGLIERFRQAEHGHVEANPFLLYVAAWLDAHRPAPLPLRLVHSDFQPANIMIAPTHDGGHEHQVIDWELAHVGDPREDLGYYNVYSSASGPNLFAADPEGFLARYRERTGFGEDAVNMQTMAYFSSLAAITVYAQVLAGAGAMAHGTNSGLMTTYTLNALTVGHNNFLAGCTPPAGGAA